MADMNRTLGALLSDVRIAPIADKAIWKRDLSKEDMWHKTLAQLHEDHFGGELAQGFDRLFAAVETGEWYYPLYIDAECAEDETRRGTNLVWFPSDDAGADDRPYVLVVPGGGFVNVWNLTEGWPVAAQFNRLGYHAFILTYQVEAKNRGMARAMEDFDRALRLIRANAARFRVQWDRYLTCGFSAGGYLVCLWNVPEKGCAAFGWPRPLATFPVYPVVSWRQCIEDAGGEAFEPGSNEALFGCGIEAAAQSPFEIPEHAQAFPPCALFLAAGDELVNPEHSKRLAAALDAQGIPCRLEIGPTGGHGFADGDGMCMAGWTARAIRWYEGLDA